VSYTGLIRDLQFDFLNDSSVDLDTGITTYTNSSPQDFTNDVQNWISANCHTSTCNVPYRVLSSQNSTVQLIQTYQCSGGGLPPPITEVAQLVLGGSFQDAVEAWNPYVYPELVQSFKDLLVGTTFSQFFVDLKSFLSYFFLFVLRDPGSLAPITAGGGV
jgi:hypothetical protein